MGLRHPVNRVARGSLRVSTNNSSKVSIIVIAYSEYRSERTFENIYQQCPAPSQVRAQAVLAALWAPAHCHQPVCCSVLQLVAVCCSVLRCGAMCCGVVQVCWHVTPQLCVLQHTIISLCVAVCCSVLQLVAVCCSVLRCGAVCCGVVQCVAAWCKCVDMSHRSCVCSSTLSISLFKSIYMYVHTHMYMYIYIYMYIYKYVYIYMYMYIYIYVCMHIYVCLDICVYSDI